MLKITKEKFIPKKMLKKLKFKYEILEENDRFYKVRYNEYKEISYEALVIKLIRKRYSIDQELAILRQRDSKIEEFNEYNSFVESCKFDARMFVAEREADRLPKPVIEEESKGEE